MTRNNFPVTSSTCFSLLLISLLPSNLCLVTCSGANVADADHSHNDCSIKIRFVKETSLDEDLTMFAFDVPLDVTPHHAPIVIAQASGVDRTIGACAPIENSDAARGTAAQILDPGLVARAYMRRIERREIAAGGKITVQKGPTHGVLKDLGQGGWLYSPAEAYFGADRATVLVETSGLRSASSSISTWCRSCGSPPKTATRCTRTRRCARRARESSGESRRSEANLDVQ
jgi:hypothetical protein